MTDMSLFYHWDTGSIPPPDYYEYKILVNPAREGEIFFRPDYTSADAPVWKESFNVSNGDFNSLLPELQRLSEQANVAGTHIGGSRETLRLQHVGRTPVELHLTSDQGRRVAQMIKDLVPQDIWRRLFSKFESYREERR